MKKSTVAIIVILGVFCTVFSILLNALINTHGKNSVIVVIMSVFIGIIPLYFLVTNANLDNFLKKLDNEKKD
jgi:hypothetical protein